MRSSTILAMTCAGLAAASPLIKKAYVTEIDTETVIVYVTEGATTETAVPDQIVTITTVVPAPVTTQAPAPVVVPVSHQIPGAAPHHSTPHHFTSNSSPRTHSTSSSASSPFRATSSPAQTIPYTSALVTPASLSSSSANVPTSKSPVATSAAPVVAPPVVSASNSDVKTPGSAGTAPVTGTGSNSATAGCNLGTPTDYASTALYWHNIHRCNNSAPALSWSDDLAKSAATLAATCKFHHDVSIGGGGYGQNIASYGTTEDPSKLDPAAQVASASSEFWYNGEINLYDPSWYGLDNPNMANFEGWGHYTQVVWKSTTQLGCASQYCQAGGLFSTMGGWFTVCNYNPPGNMGGAYGQNVLKPSGKSAVHYSAPA